MQNKEFERYCQDMLDLVGDDQKCASYRRGIEDALHKFRAIEPERTAQNFLVYEMSGEIPERRVVYGEAAYVCYMACKISCFSDCSGEKVLSIVIDGEPCEGPLWEPCMIMHITRKRDNAVVYERQFLEWDH